MEKQAVIYGISLGPGDPDLITVKGLNTLKKADKIYYPGSLFANGKRSSYSLNILEHYGLAAQKLCGFYLEMNLNRNQAQQVYETTFQQIKKDFELGLTIAVVSEGDLSTYSSFTYILEKIKQQGLKVTLIPGITSFALAAAVNQQPLALQSEKLLLLPRVATVEELNEAVSYFDTVVLMKIKSVIPIISKWRSKNTHYKVYYSERLGTPQQFTTPLWEEVLNREIPYFSLIIIKK